MKKLLMFMLILMTAAIAANSNVTAVTNAIGIIGGGEAAEAAMALWLKACLVIGQLAVIVGALATIDPTNKINKLLAKLGPIFNKINFKDDESK